MAGGEFDKDFGYLMPFLDKVAAAASGLSDPAAREELTQLVGGEKKRWTRIRQLLSGAESNPGNPGENASHRSESNSDRNGTEERQSQSSPEEERASQPRLSFTVGSLRSQGR